MVWRATTEPVGARFVECQVVAEELTRKPVHVPEEGVVVAVDVLADVDPAGAEMRQELFQRHPLLIDRVPAVVDDDVKRRSLGTEPLPEGPVRLVADEDGRLVEPRAVGVDVDAIQLRPGPRYSRHMSRLPPA